MKRQIDRPQVNLDSQGKFGSITGIVVDTSTAVNKAGKNRISSPDLWELTRLKGGNVLNLVEDANISKLRQLDETEMEEETHEVELNEEAPPFLKGQTTKAGLCLSPIKITLNPEGSLQRAAVK